MGLVRMCARCGCLYTTDTDVCLNCRTKDEADVIKLKGFLEEAFQEGETTRQDVLNYTGINAKNLDRFMGYNEFAGIKFGAPVEEKIIKGKK